MASEKLSPLEFEQAYLGVPEGDKSNLRKKLSVVLSDQKVAKLWRLGPGLENRVGHFYQTVLGEQLENIPDEAPDEAPESVRILSLLKKFRSDEVGWGQFEGVQGSQMSIEIQSDSKKKGTIISVMFHDMVKPEISQDKLYGILGDTDRNVVILYPIPTTKRFAAITFAGALNTMLAEKSKRGIRDDVASFEGQIAMAEHMTNQQYLAKIGEVLEEEGITDIWQYRKAVVERDFLIRMSKTLEPLLFPNMPALSKQETGARVLLFDVSCTWQLLRQKLGKEGDIAKRIEEEIGKIDFRI